MYPKARAANVKKFFANISRHLTPQRVFNVKSRLRVWTLMCLLPVIFLIVLPLSGGWIWVFGGGVSNERYTRMEIRKTIFHFITGEYQNNGKSFL